MQPQIVLTPAESLALAQLDRAGSLDSDSPDLRPDALAALTGLARRGLVLWHGFRAKGVGLVVRFEPIPEAPAPRERVPLSGILDDEGLRRLHVMCASARPLGWR